MKPGIHFDVNAEVYFDDPCEMPSFTQSLAKILIEQSPLHAFQAHPRLNVPAADEDDAGEKYDKAKAIGNAAHRLMLGRGKTIAMIEHKDFRTKAAQEAKAQAIEAGCEPVLMKHYDTAWKMVYEAREQLKLIEGCEKAFVDGSAEVVAVSVEDGLWLRTMMDWVTADLRDVWDYKTSGMSASPYAAGKMMDSAGWHVQAAMHERILDVLDPDGAGRRKYRYVCQENEPPFALTVSEIGEDALTIGRKKLDYAINKWRECLTSGEWPAYPLKIIRPQLPDWSTNRWLEREEIEWDERPISKPREMLTSLSGG